jgi:hypothetical protein
MRIVFWNCICVVKRFSKVIISDVKWGESKCGDEISKSGVKCSGV